MILFKTCPRCGGDIDTTYLDDAYCVQCAHRPQIVYPGPRVVLKRTDALNSPAGASVPGATTDGPVVEDSGRPAGPAAQTSTNSCPRCDSTEMIRLEKLRQHDNTCYRCRPCGHIFSSGDQEDLSHDTLMAAKSDSRNRLPRPP